MYLLRQQRPSLPPPFSKGVKSDDCLCDFESLPSRLQLIGPGWAPDPLRANQILSYKFGLGSAKPGFSE